MAIVDTINSMYENVGEVYDTITNVDINNGKNLFDYNKITTSANYRNNYDGTFTRTSNGSNITINVDNASVPYDTFSLLAGTYSVSFDITTTSAVTINNWFLCTRQNGTGSNLAKSIGVQIPANTTTHIKAENYVVLNNAERVGFAGYLSASTGVVISNIQVEKGTSSSEYQPYTDNPTYKNIENIPKVIRKSYLDIMNNGIDTIYDNWEKVNGTGTSLTLNNTEEAPMTIEYKGNTSQETTTGKNIWNLGSLSETTQAGVTLKQDIDGGFLLNGTSTGVGRFKITLNTDINEVITLYLKSFNNSGDIMISLRDTNDTQMVSMRNDNTLKVYSYTPTAPIRYIELIQLTSGVQYTNYKIYPMIVKGSYTSSTIGNYEPYTNGASPNPNYPQDIHIVSGDNYINVTGKNLLPNNATTTTVNGITFTINEDKSININGTATGGRADMWLYGSSTDTGNYIFIPKGNYTINTTNLTDGRLFLSFREKTAGVKYVTSQNHSLLDLLAQQDCYLYGVMMGAEQGQTFNNITFYPMLEKGSTTTTYEAYKGASYEINLGKNLLDLQLSIMKSLNTSGTWSENVYTHNGLTLTINDDKTIKINGTATDQETFLLENQQIKYPTGTYYLSGSINGSNNSYDIRMFNYDGTSAVAQCYTGAKEINVINNKQVYNMAIVVRSGQTLNNVVFYPMFSTSNDTNYSPYFTPIELCKIGTYKDRIFKSSGKNLFNDTIRQGVTTYDGGVYSYNATRLTSTNWITLKAGTYTINAKTNTSKTLQISNITFDTNDNFYNLSGVSGIWKTLPFTFTTPIDIKWKCNFDYSDNSNITINEVNSIMLNEGSTALPYEPYGKDWYLNKQIGKFTYNNEGSVNSPKTNYYNISGLGNQGWINTLGTNTYLSNEYPSTNVQNTDANFQTDTANMDYAFGIHSNGTTIRFKDSRGLSASDFKTDLIGTEIYFALANPTYEKITGELLNQLEAIKKSYENQTNINQENNDLPFELEVGALEKY